MSRHATPASTSVFRVRILGGFYAPPGGPSIWREVELADNQSLTELGQAIPPAFGFEDDHLWSFFLSGKPWDRASEYARQPDPPVGGHERDANGLRVGDAPATKEFLFLFDYGDEWHFGVRVVRTGEAEPGARYPRVVASQGQAPPQYPDLDDEEDWAETPPSDLAPPRFAPVELAPPSELRAAAAAAPTVRRLRTLVEWLADGRRLTATGSLTLADAKELALMLGLVDPDRLAELQARSARDIPHLELLVGWARQLRLARVHNGRLVPVRRHRRLLDDPLDLCRQATSALPLLRPTPPITSAIGSSFPGGLDEAMVHLLSLLYSSAEPVTARELAGHFWEGHVEPLLDEQAAGRPELWRLTTGVETVRLLSLLQGLGMVETGGGSDAEPAGIAVDSKPGSPAEAYLSSLAEVWSRLTPLGTWVANVLLRAAGAVAPVIGELAEADAATLIEGLSGFDEWAYRAELGSWCRQRGPRAVRDLADYARAAPGFEQRLLAFAGLREAGPAGEVEVRSMLADPELRPYAQLWLVGQRLEDPTTLDPASAGVLLAEKLASVLQEDGPDALVELLEQLGTQVDQAAVLANMWRARTPGAAAVLEAAGKAHPDPRAAKAARKAAFKLRSPRSP